MKSCVKKLIIGLVLAGSLTAGISAYAKNQYSDYASDATISSYAETLNCDTSYLRRSFGGYVRMKHNQDEPIYVGIDSNYSEEEIEAAKESLDEVFGIVGTINSKYRYVIVNEQEFDSIRGKTKIYFTLKDDDEFKEDNTHAQIKVNLNLLSVLSNKKASDSFVIYSRRKNNKISTKEDLRLDFLHELGHAFSLGDTYEKQGDVSMFKKNAANTLMNSLTDKNLQMYTPNDVKCWVSIYAESEEKVLELQQGFVKDYTEAYYKNFTEKAIGRVKGVEELDCEDIEFESMLSVNGLKDDEKYGYIYNIVIENGRYTLKIIDRDTSKLLDKCSGEIYKINGVIVLKEVRLKLGLDPYNKEERFVEGTVQDLVFGKLSKERNGKDYFMYDMYTNWTLAGNVYELQKSID